jgi:predicted small secreted protein
MKQNTSRIALILFLATLLTTLGSSCRTFRGFGRDVQHVGGHIERASHR